MKLELTIKTDYLPTWGAWEAIREAIQNGRDAQIEHGATFEVRHRKDKNTLVIENDGVTLPHEALLLGHTTKIGHTDLIGKFGEGLKLSLVVLAREGHSVKIRSGSEVWLPKIERSEKFNADVLVVYIEKNREEKNRVQVEIGGIDEDTWLKMKDLFLFLRPTRERTKEEIKVSCGTLLLSEKYKGRIFVKGIFVQNEARLNYGYDLTEGDVDRDRKMVESYNLRYYTAKIWREALNNHPELTDPFTALLEKSSLDIESLDTCDAARIAEPVRDKILADFQAKHGKSALPVETLADSAEMEHLGKKGIVVPKGLRAVLESKLGTVNDNKEKLREEVTKLYGWHELSAEEKANLEANMALVNNVVPVTLGEVDVVDFLDAKIEGMFKDDRVLLVKKHLVDRVKTLATLVHEVAHRVGRDGEHSHVATIEHIWSGIVTGLLPKV